MKNVLINFPSFPILVMTEIAEKYLLKYGEGEKKEEAFCAIFLEDEEIKKSNSGDEKSIEEVSELIFFACQSVYGSLCKNKKDEDKWIEIPLKYTGFRAGSGFNVTFGTIPVRTKTGLFEFDYQMRYYDQETYFQEILLKRGWNVIITRTIPIL